jgi:hypothetical protein
MKFCIAVLSIAVMAAQESAQTDAERTKLEAATVAYIQPGRMESEKEFNLKGEYSSPTQLQGRLGRRGSKWFSFEVPVDNAHRMALVVTYSNGEQQKRTFNILVDGAKVGDGVVESRSPGEEVRFQNVQYPIPPELIRDRERVTVRFEATSGNEIAAVFGIRMIRADAR